MEQERMEQRLRAEARDRGPTVPPPEWVDHFKSREEAAAYLAAMIDGEGSVGHYRNPCVSRTLRITNTDRELIDACSEACLLLGIAHIVDNGKALPSGKTSWELAVHRVDDIRRVAELPIRSYRKRAKLAEALASARPNYRPSRQVLEQLYVFDGKTAVEIARLLGAAPRSVLSWLRAEGIPVRSRSEATLMGHRTRAVRRAAQKAAS